MAFSVPKSFVPDTTARASDMNENFDAVEAVVNELLEAVMPVGTVIATARPAAPNGYLLCEGQAVSRSKYAALFGAIGTTYGAGDGATTFNIPDLRGRVPVGVDAGAGRLTAGVGNGGPNTLGKDGGDQRMPTHSHHLNLNTSGPLSTHNHNINMAPGTRHEGSGFAYDVMNSTPGQGLTNTGNEGAPHAHNINGDTNTEGSGSSGNMPPYQVVNYAVKF